MSLKRKQSLIAKQEIRVKSKKQKKKRSSRFSPLLRFCISLMLCCFAALLRSKKYGFCFALLLFQLLASLVTLCLPPASRCGEKKQGRQSSSAKQGRRKNMRGSEWIASKSKTNKIYIFYTITNKETWTLKESLPLLLKRRLFTKFQHVRFKINKFFIIFKFTRPTRILLLLLSFLLAAEAARRKDTVGAKQS